MTKWSSSRAGVTHHATYEQHGEPSDDVGVDGTQATKAPSGQVQSSSLRG
ncbi:MAG: hypothetical protein KDB09_09030 [Acidimicrobiales bacterium]|nr:hypothetical protein [Acidimicrobiales bacterium]